ncbi:MAG: PhnA domain-containing protein [Proteobacteria bacterium]|nr:PhnA domain-containing protein [Pseudomonadota bacterium]
MSLSKQQTEALQQRSNQQCELCRSEDNLSAFLVTPKEGNDISDYVHICEQCRRQIDNPENMDVNHWHCLNDSIWSEVPAVKVLAWRVLQHLQKNHGPQDLLDMMYLTDEESTWARSGFSTGDAEKHRDSNGHELLDGDDVTLIKDLKVKGAGFTAKQGTKVKNISLVADNPAHIEGKVESQRIVILTEFVKKQ